MPGSYEYTDEQMKLIRSVIGPTAHALSRKYHRWAEAQDVAQEMWVWVMKHPKRVLPFIEREDDRELKSGLKGLGKSLYREGDRFCRKEKAAQSGYRVTDEYFYTRQLVEELIKADANGGKLLEQAVPDDVRVKRTKSQAEGGDIMAMIADVKAALRTLDPETETMIELYVVEGWSTAKIGDLHGISRQAVDQRLDRAYEKMIDALGGKSPW